MLTDLPYEMLENIFSKLDDISDLKNVSLACKRFHNVVATSPVLLDRLTLEIDGRELSRENLSVIMSSEREYRKITLLYSENSMKSLKIVEKFKDSVKFLSIERCRFPASVFSEILGIAGHLESLKFDHNAIVQKRRINDDDDIRKLHKLFTCTMTTTPATVLFPNNTLIKLELDLLYPSCAREFIIVLESQANLKELKLHYNENSSNFLFDPSRFQNFKFKLEKFCFAGGISYEGNNKRVLDFINFQHESLKHLDLSYFYGFQSGEKKIHSMTQLEYLKLSCFEYNVPILINCPRLKTFHLNAHLMCRGPSNVFVETPNLKKFVNGYGDYQSLAKLSSACPMISKMQLCYYADPAFRGVCFPNLTEVLIECMEYGRVVSVNQLLKQNKIKKLVIGEKIEIKDVELCEILKNSGQLQELEIRNGYQLNGNIVNFEFLVNQFLKIIRIYNYRNFNVDTARYLVHHRSDFQLFTSVSKRSKTLVDEIYF